MNRICWCHALQSQALMHSLEIIHGTFEKILQQSTISILIPILISRRSRSRGASVVNETGLMGESRVWVGVGEGLLPITVMNSLLRMPSDPRAHTGESFKVHFAVDKILNLRFRILDNLTFQI